MQTYKHEKKPYSKWYVNIETRKKHIKKLHCKQINMQTKKHERNNAKKLQCKQNDM